MSEEVEWFASVNWLDALREIHGAMYPGEDPLEMYKFYVYEGIRAVFAVSYRSHLSHLAWSPDGGWRSHDGRIKPWDPEVKP